MICDIFTLAGGEIEDELPLVLSCETCGLGVRFQTWVPDFEWSELESV